MSLRLLTDEQISPVVAERLVRARPGVHAVSANEWRGGALLGKADDRLLAAAAEDGLTLVTYDQKAIAPLLSRLAHDGRHTAGIVFVDSRTVAPDDIGLLVRSLVQLLDACAAWDWQDRVCYLQAAAPP